MTPYVCTDQGQPKHGRVELGEFTARDVAWIAARRAQGDPVAASIAEGRREAEAAGHTYELVDPDGILAQDSKSMKYLTDNVLLSAERARTRKTTDTGRLFYSPRHDQATAHFRCPKCGRDRKIREKYLIAFQALAEVDISGIA